MTDAFSNFLASYEVYLDAVQGLSIAVFGASAYVVLRQSGVLAADGLRPATSTWILVLAGVASASAIIVSFFALGAVQSTFSDIYKSEYMVAISNPVDVSSFEEILENYRCISSLTGQSVTPAEPMHYFDECIRGPVVSPLVSMSFGFMFVSLILLVVWFLLQVRTYSRRKIDESKS